MSASDSTKSIRGAFTEPSKNSEKILMKDSLNSGNNMLFKSFIDSMFSTLIIWPAPQAGKIKQILFSDWLPEQARWAYLAHSGLPALFPQKRVF